MHFFRYSIKLRKLIAFIVLGMLVRSFVAPGYMLDTNPADGSFLAITLCDGPAGINAIADLLDQDHDHDHHHNHGDHSEEHEHAVQDHGFSACSFWSSSSLSLAANTSFLEPAIFLFSDELLIHQNQTPYQSAYNRRFARAPPALS